MASFLRAERDVGGSDLPAAGTDPLQDPSWQRVLARAGIGAATANWFAGLARRNGTTLHDEIMASSDIDQSAYFKAIAMEIGVEFVNRVEPERMVLRDRDVLAALAAARGPRIVQYCLRGARLQVLLSPALFDMATMKSYLRRYPDIAGRLAIVPPAILREALLCRARPLLEWDVREDLHRRFPSLSAAHVASGVQGMVLGLFLAMLAASFSAAPLASWFALHCVGSLFFLACIGLRLAALAGTCGTSALVVPLRPEETPRVPVYSLLVPLYREAAMIPQILSSLQRLDWPASKLEIKLVCEEDDRSTLAALDAVALPGNCEVLRVPPGLPRTKPKALSYALPTISGELVCVYDAEDIPDPQQLAEAWRAFEAGGPDLACVQAPLTITNGDLGWLARMFAFEYAVLFRAVLPALARWRLFLPLGGTSNHFRTSILRRNGGWDPFNVTEDADLGLRLCRRGYRIGAITTPTRENAPVHWPHWLRQRTRWNKGWMQTLLVHWRSPLAMMRELGPLSWIAAQIVLAGTVLSSLLYGLIVLHFTMLVANLLAYSSLDRPARVLLALDLLNLGLALVVHYLLGRRLLQEQKRRELLRSVGGLLIYWFLVSAASWRALGQLIRRPFHWEKTPHTPAGSERLSINRSSAGLHARIGR